MHNLDSQMGHEEDNMVVDENENLVVKASSDDNLDDSFGNLNLDNQTQFEKRTFFKLVSGDNIYRIMPPMFDGLKKGTWAVYYSDHFGFIDARGKKHKFTCTRRYDENGNMGQCFFCQDQENKKVELDLIEKKLLELKSMVDNLHQQGLINEMEKAQAQLDSLEAKRFELKERVRTRNTAFYVNAMDQAGNFGILPLKKTVYEELVGKKSKTGRRENGLFHELKNNENIDPLSPNEGVWFNITRTGTTFMDIKYRTSVVEEAVLHEGKRFKSIKKAPLTKEQKKLALVKCQNLLTMFDHLTLSLNDQKIVVDGSPQAVSAVLNAPHRKNKQNNSAPVNNDFNQEHQQFSAVKNNSSPGYVPSNDELKSMMKDDDQIPF